MNNKAHMEVSRKNGAAVEQALERMEKKIEEQQKRIDNLIQGVSALSSRIIELDQAISAMKVASLGRGPTVK